MKSRIPTQLDYNRAFQQRGGGMLVHHGQLFPSRQRGMGVINARNIFGAVKRAANNPLARMMGKAVFAKVKKKAPALIGKATDKLVNKAANKVEKVFKKKLDRAKIKSKINSIARGAYAVGKKQLGLGRKRKRATRSSVPKKKRRKQRGGGVNMRGNRMRRVKKQTTKQKMFTNLFNVM